MARFVFKSRGFVLGLLCSLVFAGVAYGDEVTDAINEGLQSYQGGKYSDAMASLNYASQLIGQKKGGDLQSFLPAPLSGWEASEATSQAAGAALFGGGVSAERRYTKDPGSVNVQIVTDSPMLQGIMTMFSNPMLLGSDGGKLERIAGEKAIVGLGVLLAETVGREDQDQPEDELTGDADHQAEAVRKDHRDEGVVEVIDDVIQLSLGKAEVENLSLGGE